jgi:parvulin-like peptidyl-prolyl isomerase
MKMEEQNGPVVEEKKDKKLKKVRSINSDKIIIVSIIIGVILIAAGLFGWFYYKTNVASVVTFNGGKVTKSEYTVYYKTFQPMLAYYGYDASVIPQQIANKAAVDKILLKQAKKAGVTLSADDKKTVDNIFADEDQTSTFVKEGIDLGMMKQLYYNDYIINSYMEQLTSQASTEDVLAYLKTTYGADANYNEYDTSHILFKTTDASTSKAMTDEQKATVKAKAEAVLAKALAGEDFATLAKDNSEDTGTASEGGKYLMYDDSATYTQYSKAVLTMTVGTIYPTLVESDAGYHIIKLNAINANGRGNSKSAREEYVNNNINKLSETENVNIKTDVLNKLIAQIGGTNTTGDSTSTGSTNTSGSTDSTSTNANTTSTDTKTAQ